MNRTLFLYKINLVLFLGIFASLGMFPILVCLTFLHSVYSLSCIVRHRAVHLFEYLLLSMSCFPSWLVSPFLISSPPSWNSWLFRCHVFPFDQSLGTAHLAPLCTTWPRRASIFSLRTKRRNQGRKYCFLPQTGLCNI